MLRISVWPNASEVYNPYTVSAQADFDFWPLLCDWRTENFFKWRKYESTEKFGIWVPNNWDQSSLIVDFF